MNSILGASSVSVKAPCYIFHLLFLEVYFFLCPTEQLKVVGNYMLNICSFVFAFNGKLLLPFIFDSLGSDFGIIMLFLAREGKRDVISKRYFPLPFFIPSFKKF